MSFFSNWVSFVSCVCHEPGSYSLLLFFAFEAVRRKVLHAKITAMF